jgi:secreted PhoX family phosphatase
MNRRSFLAKSAMTTLSFIALSRCSVRSVGPEETLNTLELVPDPAAYLDLPAGFDYKVISRAGERMSDGLLVPGRPDGMGTFSTPDQACVLIRNHENSPSPLENSPFGTDNAMVHEIARDKLYDAGGLASPGLGGTTTVIFDEDNQVVKKQFMSLAGTYRNCAGGPTPWNSWLTCEEDVTRADGTRSEQDHGFVFDVPATATGLVDPKPIVGMGRFNHEAIAVDPQSGIVYQTEDRSDGLIYRFIPNDPADLHAGGQLQALAIKGLGSFDTRNWDATTLQVGERLPVEWITLDDIEAPEDDLRLRGFAAGAARFARGEGMWYGDQEIYFACTNGGPKRFGQIFRYDVQSAELELFAESEDKTVLHMADNLTLTPWGSLLVCEDNGAENRLHLIDLNGDITLFAINRSSSSEFAGAVFSPSGKTLFVNIQENGETLAITGPWEQFFG